MADQPAKNESSASKQALDLNSLSGLNFGPNWADANAKPSRPKDYDDGRGKRGGGGGASRDRRSGGGRPGDREGPSDRRRRPSGGPGRQAGPGGPRGRRDSDQSRHSAPKPFEPTVQVDLYPQDEAFEALINRLRSSARTYQLFDIAHLLLEKPDRFIVVVSPKQAQNTQSEEANLYYSVPGHLPFETEEAAVNYVTKNHLDLFFDIEEIEIDPPKGNFLMVNRCTITGELLGPPNYHRYQEFLQRHYAARITGMSFERFSSKVEGVKEQEQIDAWLESMKKGARYTVKDRQESEPESFETLEAARHFLLQHRKDKVVGSGESVRFAGRDIERLPPGDIRQSVEAYVEHQKHFPLDSANNIRGRLRRHKFAVYKKGSKGVSFVCAVKRKFRDGKTVFTDSIRDLIDFIEKHPEIPASKLPKDYIGIDTEKQQPEKLKMAEAEVEAAAAKAKSEAMAAETQAGDPTTESADASTGAAETTEAAEAPAASQTTETPEAAAVSPEEDSPAVAENAKASTEATPKAELSEAEEKKLRQLMLDLRWLITEGYVTEYGDGRLFAPPPMPEPKEAKAKEAKPKQAKTEAQETPKEAPKPKEPKEPKAEAAKEAPEPVAEAPEPVAEAPEPAAEAPEPAAEAPEPAADATPEAQAEAEATPRKT
jgi:hypothetical protein